MKKLLIKFLKNLLTFNMGNNMLDYNKWKNLSYKKNLSGEEALKAVKEDAFALRFVRDQTEAICLKAVKKDGYALKYVKDQTEAICLEAVKQNSYALQYVEERFFKKGSIEIIIDGKSVKLSDDSVEAIRRAIN